MRVHPQGRVQYCNHIDPDPVFDCNIIPRTGPLFSDSTARIVLYCTTQDTSQFGLIRILLVLDKPVLYRQEKQPQHVRHCDALITLHLGDYLSSRVTYRANTTTFREIILQIGGKAYYSHVHNFHEQEYLMKTLLYHFEVIHYYCT